MRSPAGAVAALVALLAGACPSPAAAAEPENPARRYFTDVELVTHEGRAVRFYSDLLAGKVVVVNSFFAECHGICPVMAGKLVQLQEWLGDRLGAEVHIVSITVDAGNDSPERLAGYAERWRARPGWYFVSGEPAEVGFALGRLGFAVEDREAHSSLILVGNESTGLWIKANGLAPPQELLEILQRVLGDGG